jgi:hypothetical protein
MTNRDLQRANSAVLPGHAPTLRPPTLCRGTTLRADAVTPHQAVGGSVRTRPPSGSTLCEQDVSDSVVACH